MNLHHWAVLLVAVLAVIGLSLMPRYVVKNNAKQLETNQASVVEQKTTHSNEMTSSDRQSIDSLRQAINKSNKKSYWQNLQKIVKIFVANHRYDSAAVEVEHFYTQFLEDSVALRQVGELYYEAFIFAADEVKAANMASNARRYLAKYVEKNPEDLDAQAKLAMTLTLSENPMQAVLALREILAKNPNHSLALFNLGILSLRTQQYDKALEKFLKLVSLKPDEWQYYFYAAVCYKELGRKQEAIEALNTIRQNEKDPQLLEATHGLLKELGINN